MATKRKKTSKDYKAYLRETLADPNEAAEYLNAALEEGDENVFLLALRDVAEAHGIAKLAGQANLNRESTYKMLSEQGNPRLSSLWALLDSIGLRLSVESK
jgi:probable addiction module antidote protein